MSAFLPALRAARDSASEVEIVVTDCLYGCCSRPPSRRAGYAQAYRGVVAHVDERKLVLHSIALRALNYHVVAELEHIEDVTLTEEAPCP